MYIVYLLSVVNQQKNIFLIEVQSRSYFIPQFSFSTFRNLAHHEISPNMTAEERATALKQKGNKAFAAHDWPTAVDFYTQAIEASDKDPSFYCNRAQVLCRYGFLQPATS